MLIGHLTGKSMAATLEGDRVPDPVDLEGEPVAVTPREDGVEIGRSGDPPIRLDPLQAEELAFAVLTVVEHEADLSYTIQRTDRNRNSGRVFDPNRARIEDLAELRRTAGVSQADLAARSGLRREIVSRLEKGGGNPTVSTLHRFAAGLGGTVSLTFSVGGREFEIDLPYD